MKGFAGKVAVVTGAGSGIGQALAIELARSGALVAISDINPDGLAETEQKLKSIGGAVKADLLDVSDRDAFIAYAEAVNDHFGRVNQIYNNAGIAFYGDVEVSTFSEIERVMDINYWGVVNGTKAFLPYLIGSGDGHVINVSSAFGLFGVPGQAAYNSAKFAVRGFTEALQQELAVARHPVRATLVFPGNTPTAFFDSMSTAKELGNIDMSKVAGIRLWTTSRPKAARAVLHAVQRRRVRILIGPDTKILDLAVRLTGSTYQRVVPPLVRLVMKPER